MTNYYLNAEISFDCNYCDEDGIFCCVKTLNDTAEKDLIETFKDKLLQFLKKENANIEFTFKSINGDSGCTYEVLHLWNTHGTILEGTKIIDCEFTELYNNQSIIECPLNDSNIESIIDELINRFFNWVQYDKNL